MIGKVQLKAGERHKTYKVYMILTVPFFLTIIWGAYNLNLLYLLKCQHTVWPPVLFRLWGTQWGLIYLSACPSFIMNKLSIKLHFCVKMFLLMIFETETPKAHHYSAAFKAPVYLQFSTSLRYFDNSVLMHFQSLFKSLDTKLHSVRAVRHSNVNKNAEAADSRACSRHKRVAQSTRRQKQKWTQGREGREIPCATA